MSAPRWIASEVLPGRDHPDASEAPSGRVEAGGVLLECERVGLWVRVETPQGRRLWVDGRRLEAAAPVVEPDGPESQARQQADPAPAEPTPKPAPPPETMASQSLAPVWAATHTVPAGGLPAWAQPDPAGAVIATLAARVQLRVIERRADWAHVDAENGWKGWVDGRRLVANGGVTSQTPQPSTTSPAEARPSVTKSISLRSVAAVMVPISAFLPWLGFWYGSATDVPAAFLWSPYAELSFPNMGTVMFVVGATVMVAEFMDRYARYRRIAAGVAVGVAALYLVQTFRVFLDYESQFTTAVSTMFTEGLGIGPLVALAAGITLLVKRQPETTAS